MCRGEPGYEMKHLRSGTITVESIILLHNIMVPNTLIHFLLAMSIEYTSLL